ncbi:MAG: ECF-type sigma factor [Planctomycetota bacterium]
MEVTRLLQSLGTGEPGAEQELLGALYDQLYELARSKMARERASHTLNPTLLLDEAWMRLRDQQSAEWVNRQQFLGVAALVMRRMLVNHARARAAGKRSGAVEPLRTSIPASEQGGAVDILVLDEVLSELGERRPELAKVVELRFFAGLSVDETAAAVGASPRTVDRRWDMARGWLYTRLQEQGA